MKEFAKAVQKSTNICALQKTLWCTGMSNGIELRFGMNGFKQEVYALNIMFALHL